MREPRNLTITLTDHEVRAIVEGLWLYVERKELQMAAFNELQHPAMPASKRNVLKRLMASRRTLALGLRAKIINLHSAAPVGPQRSSDD